MLLLLIMKEDSVNKMEFTYDAYRKLLLTFKNNGYQDIFYLSMSDGVRQLFHLEASEER